MSNEQKPENTPPARNMGKRAYVKPAFRHEQVFEVMALACGKISGTSGPCSVNRKTS